MDVEFLQELQENLTIAQAVQSKLKEDKELDRL